MASHLWEEYGKSGEGPQLGKSHRLWPKVKCPRLSMSNLSLPSKCSSESSDPKSEPFGQSECHSGQDGSTRGSSEAEAKCGGCSVSDKPWVFSSDHEKCWEPLAALPVHWPVLSHCKGRAGRSKLYTGTISSQGHQGLGQKNLSVGTLVSRITLPSGRGGATEYSLPGLQPARGTCILAGYSSPNPESALPTGVSTVARLPRLPTLCWS